MLGGDHSQHVVLAHLMADEARGGGAQVGVNEVQLSQTQETFQILGGVFMQNHINFGVLLLVLAQQPGHQKQVSHAQAPHVELSLAAAEQIAQLGIKVIFQGGDLVSPAKIGLSHLGGDQTLAHPLE